MERLKPGVESTEGFFRHLFDKLPGPIAVYAGRELRFEFVNQCYQNLFAGKELLGKRLQDVFSDGVSQAFYRNIEQVYDTGTPFYSGESNLLLDFHNLRDDKRLYYFNYTSYQRGANSVEGVIAYGQEIKNPTPLKITEQVKAEKKPEGSQVNFSNLILQIPVAICVLLGSDHVVEIVNQSATGILGKSASDIIGKPLASVLPELAAQGFLSILDRVYSTGDRFEANEHGVRLFRNGAMETAYINFVFEAFRENEERISGVMCVGTEVTEQVLVRKDNEYAEEKARLAIGSADLGTYEINLLTDEMITSPRFNHIWGFTHCTRKRSEYASVIHPDDLDRRATAHQESLLTGNLHYEARVIWKDKSIHWVKITGRVLYDDKMKPIWLLGIIQDITEQKIFSQELTRNVSERTKSLEEINERIARSNEELEQFAYITSHDLQEPLRKIQVFSNILLDDNKADLPPKALEMLEKVVGSAARMGGLIRDLLNYSRVARGEILFEDTDLNLIAKNVLSDFELMIAQKNANITVETLPLVQAVPLQMNQLFYNLIGNALKFSRKNIPLRITIGASLLNPEKREKYAQLNASKEYYEFVFRDNGIGFQQEYADKIFIIFQKLNAQSMFGGYGIGLAICRKIVENHHGIIYATGRINEGAIFSIILPSEQDKV